MNPTLAVVAKVARGLGEPSLLLDAALGFVEANAAFADLCGVRLKHIGRAGRAPLELLRCDTDDPRARATEALSRRAPIRLGELRVQTLEGLVLTVHQTFIPVEDQDGVPVGLLITYRNVTDESRLQEHYRELLLKEKQRAEALETAVAARTRDLMAALEQVTHLSRIDGLTGVLNRRSFTEEADKMLRAAEASGLGVGLLLLDLDHFKAVNDQHGHLAGDKVLKVCAAALKRSLAPTEIVGRFGGEEFVALLPDADTTTLHRMAELCCAAVRAITFGELVPGAHGHLSISAGFATYPRDAKTLDELMLRADQALYAAKAAGRDCVRAWSAALPRRASHPPEAPRP